MMREQIIQDFINKGYKIISDSKNYTEISKNNCFTVDTIEWNENNTIKNINYEEE